MSAGVAQAAITTTGGVLVALIGVLVEIVRRQAKHTATIRDAIGDPNGHGDVVQMLTTVLAGQAGQDNRIARLEGGQHQLRGDLAATRADVAALAGRVTALEDP